MVITAIVGTVIVNRILVDTEADSNFMFRNVFDALGLRDADLQTHQHGVVGLGDHFIKPDGIISLPTSVGQGQKRRTVMAEFVILRDSTAYNIILGRKILNDLGAVISTRMLVMKFIAENGSVGSVKGDLETAVACDTASLSLRKKSKEASGVFLADLDARVDDKPRSEPEGDLEKFRVGNTEEKFTFVNRNLPHELKEPLMKMIRANGDLFAWTPADMPEIDPRLMSHHLAIKPEAKPVAQKRRKMSQKRAEEVARQTASLLEAGFIWKLDYSTWLSNVVLIPMHRPDEEKTAFITLGGTYCYKVMPFGLKNVGATYQRLMNKIFSDLIGKTVEVYVDDILAKTTQPSDLISDLENVFASLRQHAKALPFFNLMKKGIAFEWTPACEEAFNHFKEILAAPPILGKPRAGEPLYLYLAIIEGALATVLVREEAKAQQPIYFVSKALQGAELRYNKLEKLALALLTSSRRLRQYFQGHQVVVRTDQEIRQVLQKPDLAGRMMTWAIELSQYDLRYEPRHAIKAQAMADFLVEVTGDPTEDTVSNNQAEYEALLGGLILAREVGATRLEVCSDSQIVTSQVNGSYQARDSLLQKYLERVKELNKQFEEVTVQHVPRERNTRADLLSKLASTKPGTGNRSLIQGITREPVVALHLTKISPSWMDPITNFLENGDLPGDEKEAKTLRREAAKYTVIQGQLLKKGLSQPLLKYLHPDQTDYVLREVHEGCCGHHIGGKALARKLIRAGYYWPSMMEDSKAFVKKCVKCQENANFHRAPANELSLMTSSQPFAQ
ncbi:uncharacterized protein [Arachis hypogaea]|uniref:uncharacterized protein n=1 Tax=Arachis hypogaea TaxID=3818 RepID=UPI003B21289E